MKKPDLILFQCIHKNNVVRKQISDLCEIVHRSNKWGEMHVQALSNIEIKEIQRRQHIITKGFSSRWD